MTPVNSSGLELLAILIGQDKLLVAVIDVVQDVLLRGPVGLWQWLVWNWLTCDLIDDNCCKEVAMEGPRLKERLSLACTWLAKETRGQWLVFKFTFRPIKLQRILLWMLEFELMNVWKSWGGYGLSDQFVQQQFLKMGSELLKITDSPCEIHYFRSAISVDIHCYSRCLYIKFWWPWL